MSLVKYKSKRNFKATPEPKGGKADAGGLRFVIQKHDATRLHYDFRLEMDGVLKSWAVPKGPSTDPRVKRLAMMVEDHPYDYRSFEGIIPSGYGAGTVIIWDEGFYMPADADTPGKPSQNREMLQQLRKGKLTIILKGKKLKGAYALVRTPARGENGWLLFKMKDKYASTADITQKNKSVISSKTLQQVEKSQARPKSPEQPAKTKLKKVLQQPGALAGPAPHQARTAVKPAASKKIPAKDTKRITQWLEQCPASAFPRSFSPMLATLVDKPFDQEGWLYEVKWDGYRAIGMVQQGKAELVSRNQKSFSEKFYPVTAALASWDISAVVDGEIVVVHDNGISNFSALQNWRSEADGKLYYYLFDIVWLNGRDLTALPLQQRKMILQANAPRQGIIRISQAFEETGTQFFEAAKKMGLEGIIAKKADSAYEPGLRTDSWLKIKAVKKQEMVIGGYTRNKDSSKRFSALLVGVYENGHLRYTGKIGTGFNDALQREMMQQFKPLVVQQPPFTATPDINKPSRFRPNPPQAMATWLKPRLVCEVSFTEMTADGVMRHPSFEGLRSDKKAKQVIMEKAVPAEKKIRKSTAAGKQLVEPADKKERKLLLNPKEETQVKKINGHELKFTNLAKIYWPKEKITKRDMLNYYYRVAPYILPYLKNRPQSMNRHPDGITGESFYFKDVSGKAPEWVETFLYHSEADGRDRKYLVAKDEASLLYMASLGCIEMNPWHSRVEKEDYPDWCIIDLDPAKNTFNQVIEAANITRSVLESLGITGYPKTSGSTGIHIYIPLGAKYTYEQSKELARVIARMVHEAIPGFTSIERSVKNRRGKMYIDFLQNRPQATVSAPYSLRPRPGATVSMPLYWEEVKKGLKMEDFTLFNALERIKSEGDIFKPVIGKGINLEKIVKQFPGNRI